MKDFASSISIAVTTKPRQCKVAAARRLAVRLYRMLRSNTPYPEIARIEGSPRDGVVGGS